VTPVGSEVEPAAGSAPPEEDDFYDRTRFFSAAKRYGLWDLIGTWGSLLALIAGGAVLWFYLEGWLAGDGLKALGVAYISLGAALFGIVLAGLAVVAAFFDRDYVNQLREAGTLDQALFGFWWVAALAVLSLIVSVALTIVAYVDASRSVTAVVLTVATVLFMSAVLEALALVGTLMRHGLYRAESMAREITIKRGPNA
jgi:hypothetical protein